MATNQLWKLTQKNVIYAFEWSISLSLNQQFRQSKLQGPSGFLKNYLILGLMVLLLYFGAKLDT